MAANSNEQARTWYRTYDNGFDYREKDVGVVAGACTPDEW